MHRKNLALYLKSWRTWLFLGYISLIIYFSLIPGNELGWFSKLWKYDKVVHFIEYLGVGFLMINMLMIRPLKKTHFQFTIIFLLLFPLFDELLQHYTPRRIPDIYDGIADVCGGFLGAYIRKII
jgi:glycopeptide antibiotics resistance protein